MDKVSTKVGLVFLFFGSFFIFLYLSFPYGVLKEALSTQVFASTGMTIRIEELGPAFPFGFDANGVEIGDHSTARLSFKEVRLTLSPFQLFFFRLGVHARVESVGKGRMDVSLGFPLHRLFGRNGFIPSSLSLNAKSFPLDSIVSYGLKHLASSGVGGPLAGPVLGALAFRGNLNGDVNVSIDQEAISQSKGDVSLSVANASLILSDPAIGLPDQIFKSAQIKGSMASNIFAIARDTRFQSDELELGVDGKINVKNTVTASDLDLKVLVKLSGGLADKFGWVMDGLTSGASKGGSLNLQLRGTLGAPVSTTL
jgi:hypothetical protein